MTTAPPPVAAAYDSSEEERSLLFSDSEPESSQSAGDNDNNNISDMDDNDDLQWEDFMARYWSHSSTATQQLQLDITANADKIIMMEDTDMAPHPLEPELDNIYISHSNSIDTNNFNNYYPTKPKQHHNKSGNRRM